MGRSRQHPIALSPGETLDGKYVVENVIGEGGMGVVVAARHLGLGNRVAVKVLRADLVGSDEAVARFDREARAAVALTSDHVARVLDVGRTADGAPYIVMEYLSGSSLSELAKARKVSVRDVLALALDICDALAEAHSLGIIHRDLKPDNVFVVDRANGTRTAKVLDFGIAKVDASIAGGTSLTTTGSMLGTPWYMAPEQLDTKRGVSPKTDVWALGATIYNALTLKAPFQADSFYELSVKIYAHEPTPITTHRPELAPEVVELVHGCLQKDLAKRSSLEDVVRGLERILAQLDDEGSPEEQTVVNPHLADLQRSTRVPVTAEARGPVTAEARGPLPPSSPALTAKLSDTPVGPFTPQHTAIVTPSSPSLPPPAMGSVPNLPLGPNVGTVTPYVTPPPAEPAPSIAPWLGITAAIALVAAGLFATVLSSRPHAQPPAPADSSAVPVPVPVPVPDPTPAATTAPTPTLLGVSPPPEPPASAPASAPPPRPSSIPPQPTARATIRRPPPPPPTSKPEATSSSGALTRER